MNDLERLIARANITETKARYCQMLDTKNVGGLRAVFTENATLDASESVSIKNPETGSYDRPLGDAKRQGNSVIAERSEEHTSELQSLMRISYAVFCLKTKKQNK